MSLLGELTRILEIWDRDKKENRQRTSEFLDQLASISTELADRISTNLDISMVKNLKDSELSKMSQLCHVIGDLYYELNTNDKIIRDSNLRELVIFKLGMVYSTPMAPSQLEEEIFDLKGSENERKERVVNITEILHKEAGQLRSLAIKYKASGGNL